MARQQAKSIEKFVRPKVFLKASTFCSLRQETILIVFHRQQRSLKLCLGIKVKKVKVGFVVQHISNNASTSQATKVLFKAWSIKVPFQSHKPRSLPICTLGWPEISKRRGIRNQHKESSSEKTISDVSVSKICLPVYLCLKNLVS